MTSSRKAKQRGPDPIPGNELGAYWADALQRAYLFWDTLLDRGNNYVEHLGQGMPALLKFDHEVVLDGRTLPEPCNYSLLRLVPPAGMPADAAARPVVVVDPRAGHGPGIGGFKFDSEVGMAMRAGHPVYFVTFRQEPENGQTLVTVMHAEARFLEEIIRLHPQCKAKPVVIGNCQAGWAMMIVDALRPELFGPLMMVGAPVSFWAGSAKLNPMRYTGAPLGGSWLVSLMADLGGDRFDGAQLVENFERLNPAHAWWNKYYKLWSHIDTESPRFLEFERWWGGFCRMTGTEIEAIVENLFIGNNLARGTMQAGDRTIDLRDITAPIVVFASWGDNITPPPQALNWIIDTWGDERAIAAAGRTIVYVLHESVGHLGIFVGGEIALKEHDQLVASLDVIESLPPGLYEMKLEAKQGLEDLRWEKLEPGDYTVHYEYRTMDDIRALNPDGRDEEALFSTLAQVSKQNAELYKTWGRPWVRQVAQRPVSDALGDLNPMRLQRKMLCDTLPLAALTRALAEQAREHRTPVDDDNPWLQIERNTARLVGTVLDSWRDQRDAWATDFARYWYGPDGAGAWLKPAVPDADVAQARAHGELEESREAVLARIGAGGFAEAVCRIVLAGMASIGAFERRSLRLAKLLAPLAGEIDSDLGSQNNWILLLKEQARITSVAPVEALNALEHLLPDTETRERALAVSAAVMMIEPTLANPRSEIIEFLIDTLGVDPQRVIGLARRLTDALEKPGKAVRKTARKTAAKAAAPTARPKRRSGGSA